ncbi:hypothetical protein ACLOJK_033777 [Asimina triloba]
MVGFIISRASSKILNRLLQSPPPTTHLLSASPPAISRCLRSLHSLLSHRFDFRDHGRFHYRAISSRSESVPMNEAAEEALSAALALDDRVPATVITGFLGSGKFGEVDIDGSLVASHNSVAEDIVMVNNGCLCCTVRGDLVKLLLELVKKKRDKFDHIVIETTGLAKPAPVIDTFCNDELVARYVKLDGVVTLVDCKHAMQHLNEVKPRWVVNEAVEQVAYADRIILNKIDLVNEADLEAFTHKIKHINAMAQIKQAQFGVVDMDFVLGIGGYDLDRIDSEVQMGGCHDAAHHERHDHGHHGGHHHHDHVHDSAVSSVSIVSEGTLDLDEVLFFFSAPFLSDKCKDLISENIPMRRRQRLPNLLILLGPEVNDWLERLVDEKGDDLYRMKGVLSVEGFNERYVFQGVHSTLDGCPAKPWGPDEKRINKLVFIGRNLDEAFLKKGFKGCLV